LLLAILNIPVILNASVKIKPIIFVKSTGYPRFSNRNPLKQNKNSFGIKRKKPRTLNRRFRPRLFVSENNRKYLIKKQKIIIAGLNSLNKLDTLEETERKKHKEKKQAKRDT
jgi:hypothetical protein